MIDAFSTRAFQAVRAAQGRVAASASERPEGASDEAGFGEEAWRW